MKTKTKKTNKLTAPTMACSACSAVPVGTIQHAPWNPRTPEELKPEHPEMQKLVESVKKLGVVQPVAIWRDGDLLVCIAGNRRLEAAKLVGLETIAAMVYTDITEAQARAITRAENEVRFGVSPLLDAKMIADLKTRGLSQAEIAAVLGTSEAKVCRRCKLTELSDETRQFFELHEYEAAALEFLADKSQGDAELQREILGSLDYWAARNKVTLSDVRSAWRQNTCLVDFKSKIYTTPGGEARRQRCATCGLCTGNQPDLFADLEDAKSESRCLDASCMKKMQAEAKNAALVAEIEKLGGSAEDAKKIVKTKSWEFKDRGCKPRRSKVNCVPYVAVMDYEGFEYEVQWGPDPKKAKAEADAKEKAEASEYKKMRDRMYELFDTISEKFENSERAEIGGCFLPDGAPVRLQELVGELVVIGLFDSCAARCDENVNVANLYELLPTVFSVAKSDEEIKEFVDLYSQVND